MLLQWSQHPQVMVDRISSLLNRKCLLDITLAAEGKFIKAHKVVLSAVSKYFEDLLCETQEQQPVIYFRDVCYTELETLVQFIYSGTADVPGSSLDSFLSLAKSLGVTGFVDTSDIIDFKSQAKRKLLLNNSSVKDKENIDPVKKTIQNNSPPTTPTKNSFSDSQLYKSNSASKKRKILAQSVASNKQDSSVRRPVETHLHTQSCPLENRTKTPSIPKTDENQPLYANETISHPFSVPDQPLYANITNHQPTKHKQSDKPLPNHSSNKLTSTKAKAELTPILTTHTTPSQSSDAVQSKPPATHGSKGSNFSYDCHFPDPDELAAKGATLLHHLAVWMIQQKTEGETVGQSCRTAVGDALPPPSSNETLTVSTKTASPHCHSRSLPTRRQNIVSSSFSPTPQILQGQTVRGGSELYRPDSGFDSKDYQDEEPNVKEEGSSPEVREMSRQALARQPVLKKKRILQQKF